MLFIPSEKGQGLVEYGLIIILIAIAAIFILSLLGQVINAQFYDKIITALESI